MSGLLTGAYQRGALSFPAVGSDGEFARRGDLLIRRMGADDLPLLTRWRNEPHVLRWWQMDEDPNSWTVEDIRREYGGKPASDEPSNPCIIVVGERPVGFLQWYRWADYPEGAAEMGIDHGEGRFGVDILIGEPDVVGKGVGPEAVDLLCVTLFEKHGATGLALLTAIGNEAAQRAYEKAGLHKVRRALDTDVKGGQRVESWLMVRNAGPAPADRLGG
jgi:aminoglycoside 6'-N-acetyltransferase